MNDFWRRYQNALTAALTDLSVSAGREAIDPEAAMLQLCLWTSEVRASEGMIHFVGNGASACLASHLAIDWTKNAGVRATAYNDPAMVTAIGNDLGYERLFAAPIQWYARRGDLLVTISSSGNSPNIVWAVEAARAQGLRVVTFSGMKPDNLSRMAGDLNFYVPGWSYGIIECSHQVLLHAWLDRAMNVREWEMIRPQFS